MRWRCKFSLVLVIYIEHRATCSECGATAANSCRIRMAVRRAKVSPDITAHDVVEGYVPCSGGDAMLQTPSRMAGSLGRLNSCS